MTEKVMIIGDVHGNLNRLQKLLKVANEHGIRKLIQLGDFGFIWDNASQFRLRHLSMSLDYFRQSLWFIDGNHENFDLLYQYPIDEETGRRPIIKNVEHLPRGYRFELGTNTWMALGGAASIDRGSRQQGVSWWPQEELTLGDVIRACGDPVDVLLTHDCPEGVTVPGLTKLPENILKSSVNHQKLLRSAVDVVKPKVLFHGHFHTSYEQLLIGADYQTIVYGIGHDGGRINNNYRIIDIT